MKIYLYKGQITIEMYLYKEKYYKIYLQNDMYLSFIYRPPGDTPPMRAWGLSRECVLRIPSVIVKGD